MSYFNDMFNVFSCAVQKSFKPDFKCKYVTSCQSNIFNEYVRKRYQDGSGHISEERAASHDHVPNYYWSPDTGECIDVAYEEITE